MTTNPEEHDFIKEVCAGKNCTAYSGLDSPEHSNECLAEAAKSQGWDFIATEIPPRLSDDPAVRLAECREDSFEEDGFRTVPLSILAAACHAIQNQKEAPKLLAHIRRYTLGDLAKPAFDETAERDKAYEAWDGNGEWVDFRDGWLACAKSRAEVK